MKMQVQALTLQESAQAVEEIDNLRSLWTQIGQARFHTLGKALYQQMNTIDEYRQTSFQLNGVMWKSFEHLYNVIFGYLTEFLGAPVHHVPGTALPGFHIFQYAADCVGGEGGAHFDLSFLGVEKALDLKLGWPPEHFSYTCALELPRRCETGLDLFPVRYDANRPVSSEELSMTSKPVFFPYQVGMLSLFNGYQLHRISLNGQRAVEGRRISLQGHLFRLNKDWITYW